MMDSLQIENYGPIDHRLPGVMGLRLSIDGDWVAEAKPEFGYTTKSIESTILNLPYVAACFFAGKLDGESPFFYEWALSLAIEKIQGFQTDRRTECIRILFSELTRISAHLKSTALLARAVGVDTGFHYLLRERERILDLFELATGARFSLNVCRPGGLGGEVSEGFVERVKEYAQKADGRFYEYHTLLTENRSFKKRTQKKGILLKEDVQKKGVSGIIARSLGIEKDLRKDSPYSLYSELDWNVSICPDSISEGISDTYTRHWVRMAEILESLEILSQVCAKTPVELVSQAIHPLQTEARKIRSGKFEVGIETQRGALRVQAQMQAESLSVETQWKTPSDEIAEMIPSALAGAREEDVFLILQGLDFSVSEIDR